MEGFARKHNLCSSVGKSWKHLGFFLIFEKGILKSFFWYNWLINNFAKFFIQGSCARIQYFCRQISVLQHDVRGYRIPEIGAKTT
jgi:hypothetical protein